MARRGRGTARTPGSGDETPRIGDIFRETRAAQGEGRSLRRFAAEVLEGRIEPVMLSYIEKGERFPNEALVRHLASVRAEPVRPLLAILWRDRISYAIRRELDRALESEDIADGLDDGEITIRLSRGMAALPDDGQSISLSRFRRELRRGAKARRRRAAEERALDDAVVATLQEHGLIVVEGNSVRRVERHFQATTPLERREIAGHFAEIFAKGLVDRAVLPQSATGTYQRNHYCNVEQDRIDEFHAALEDALRDLTEKFAAEPTEETALMNVLATATTRGKGNS